MKYVYRPIPTSVVRLRTSTIATYENSAFLAPDAGWYRKFPSGARQENRAGRLLVIAASAALLIAILFLGAAAAQADPVSLGNQATIVRFTNKVKFGAAQGQNAQTKINAGFAHFFAARNAAGPVNDAVATANRELKKPVKQVVKTARIIR